MHDTPALHGASRAQVNAGAWLDIDLAAIVHNWRLLKQQANGRADCAAVVKADAYGLGAAPVATALHAAGCRRFFVAHLDEGLTLRPLLPADATLFVMHGLLPGSELEAVTHGLVPVLNSLAQVQAWTRLARGLGRRLPAALQMDTGMARLGVPPEEFDRLAADPQLLAGVDLQLVMSHLVSAEQAEAPINALQLQRFAAARARLPAAPASLANSSGVWLGAVYHHDLLRPGAALYGVAPMAGRPNPMRPVVRLRSKVLQLRHIAAGTGVGYGHAWTAQRPTLIATLATGYADGWLRSLSNRGAVRFNGQVLPLVGKVSMDTITVDATDLPAGALQEGSLLDLLDEQLTVDDVAAAAGTIGYEVLTSLGSRYARQYLRDEACTHSL